MASGVVLIHAWVTCVNACGSVVHSLSETGSRSPRVSPHSCFVGGVNVPQGEGSTVIHRKKNDLLYKETTPCVTASGNVISVVNRS